VSKRQLDRPFSKHYDGGDVDEWLASYTETMPLDALRFLAAERAGHVEGLLTWRHLDWNHTIWLVDIRARADRRRRGVGSALVEHLKRVARRERVRGISVETQLNNYPAIQFYVKHGFRISGFDDHLYTNADYDTQDIATFLFWEAA
jgi:ribosomal protein S18 acetylase RimI-like enzyme